VPASAFFEFTGKKYPKAKHRFTLTDAPFIAIAGLWREGKSNQPPSFTMLTTELGPDVVPYHNRLAVVLRPADWAAWIDPTVPEADLLKPPPSGSLTVETVRPASG
jgi:putative SOS response-associated peptidase YedK